MTPTPISPYIQEALRRIETGTWVCYDPRDRLKPWSVCCGDYWFSVCTMYALAEEARADYLQSVTEAPTP